MSTHPFREKITISSPKHFRDKARNKKIIIFFPWNNSKNLFLESFLRGAKDGLLYYRVSSQETTLTTWLNNLVETFEDVLVKFGSRLREAIPTEDPVAQGKALAADLALLKIDPITFYIDEVNNLSEDENFSQFVHSLVKSLPEKVQIAVSSKVLNSAPWVELVAQGEAVVLATEYKRNELIFNVEKHLRPQLEVNALKRGTVFVNSEQVNSWDGALPRNLFFFFMDRPTVTREEIFQAFWRELSVKEATNVFHVTKRKITERVSMKVGDSGNYELTQYNAGFYMPSDKVIRHYDVDDFQDAVERSISTDGSAREVAEYLSRAIDLYKEPFLENIEMNWVQVRREELRLQYAQALIGMGRNWRPRDVYRSLDFFKQAIAEVPQREDVHRTLMSLYLEIYEYDNAYNQYRTLEHMLRTKLQIEPSRETREIYDEIVKHVNI